ncbi:hypothetical protein [Chitinophaga flava]|uniref:Uncharacterized protein n=1 Tax=Chitinophaga flava TaxID=2259036 RepID=A0A365XZK3_9BACT|nr:hypothetical protein [Chitinophaga flava]RBL91816.1 hypothetical protein DF182_04220 [Chitinophaga flava]
MNFEGECLREAGLLDAPSLQSMLGEDWTEEDIRRIYPRALPNVLNGRELLLVKQLVDIDGYSHLYKIGRYYLFEAIDRWMHEVFASEPFMLELIAEMNHLKKIK